MRHIIIKGKQEKLGETKFMAAVWLNASISEWQKQKLLEVCVGLHIEFYNSSDLVAIEVNPSDVANVMRVAEMEGIKILTNQG